MDDDDDYNNNDMMMLYRNQIGPIRLQACYRLATREQNMS